MQPVNLIMTSFNITPSTAAPGSYQYPAYGYLVLLCVPVITVLGNVLMILAVLSDKKLRVSVTNRYTAALAFSDLLIGLVPMPLAVYVKVNRDHWDLGAPMCRFYVALDVAGSTASILHLVLISGDRYLAVMWPHEYQRYSKRAKISFAVMLVWLISLTLSIPVIMGKSILNTESCWLENPEYMLYSSLLSFYIPAGVLTLIYVKIFRKLNRHKGIRSMLRASGAMCGTETGAPFHLPLVVVQEVSYAPTTDPIMNNNEKSDSSVDSTALIPKAAQRNADFDETCACSTAVAAAVRRMLIRSLTCPALVNDEQTADDGARNRLLKQNTIGAAMRKISNQSKHSFQKSLSKQTLHEEAEDDPDPPPVPRPKIPPKKRAFKRAATTVGRRPCVLSKGRLSLYLSGHADKEDPISPLEAIENALLPGGDHLNPNSSESQLLAHSDSRLTVTARASGTLRKLANRLTNALQKKTEKQVMAKEKKATKLVALILGVFIISWLPFFTFNTIRGICLSLADSAEKCDWLPAELFFITTWLGYANSGFNPIIYGLVNEHFRATYKRILKWPTKLRRHRINYL